jgi:hypothetical protein
MDAFLHQLIALSLCLVFATGPAWGAWLWWKLEGSPRQGLSPEGS